MLEVLVKLHRGPLPEELLTRQKDTVQRQALLMVPDEEVQYQGRVEKFAPCGTFFTVRMSSFPSRSPITTVRIETITTVIGPNGRIHESFFTRLPTVLMPSKAANQIKPMRNSRQFVFSTTLTSSKNVSKAVSLFGIFTPKKYLTWERPIAIDAPLVKPEITE
jgi:hypothetical protein